MKTWLLSGMLVVGVLVAPGVMAQTVNLDMDPSTAAVDPAITVNAGGTFEIHLVVVGAATMTGVSVDIAFDATDGLTLLGIKEIPGDLDFSGDLQLSEEVLAIINQFICEFNFACTFDDFVDGFGRGSAVVYDANANQQTDLDEVLVVINEFIDEFNFVGTNYWTRVVKQAGGANFRESVEIFDPPTKSNVGGTNPGLIDDITAVLLKRPGEDFYFTGDAIIAKLSFQAKNAGTYEFSFPNAVWIDNTFLGEQDIKYLTQPSPLPSVTVQ